MKDFLRGIHQEIRDIFNTVIPIRVVKTRTVPNVEDSGFTIARGGKFKAKTIDTCVLFIDIRNSTQLNFKHSEDILAKLYSAFIATILRAAEYFGGYVRNINGDRVMIVFDTENCFFEAFETAVLLNTVTNHILSKYLEGSEFKCGIGIDYGSMLVVKTGKTKQGDENQFYKSFVWLGKPANLASKLTDMANKEIPIINITRRFRKLSLRNRNEMQNIDFSYRIEKINIEINDFAENLTKLNLQDAVKYNNAEVLFWSKIKTNSHAILMTQEMYAGLQKHFPNYIKYINMSSVRIRGYKNNIYGSNAHYRV